MCGFCCEVRLLARHIVQHPLQLFNIASQLCGLNFVQPCSFLFDLVKRHIFSEDRKEVKADLESHDQFSGLSIDKVELA